MLITPRHLNGQSKALLDEWDQRFPETVAGTKLYTTKLPVTAIHVLNNDVLSFFEKYQAQVHPVITDNGREFCGRHDQHPYELFLQLKDIDHRKTKIKSPQTNGFVERLHRTILDEHFRVVGRKTWHETVDDIQKDLDAFLVKYNEKRPHQGRNMNGTTPLAAFKKGLESRPEKHRIHRGKRLHDIAPSRGDCQVITVTVQLAGGCVNRCVNEIRRPSSSFACLTSSLPV